MTAGTDDRVRVTGVADPLAGLIAEAAGRALAAVGRDLRTPGVMICVDDLPGAEEIPWYGSLDPDAPHKKSLVLYCSREAFLEPVPSATILGGGLEIWERSPLPPPDEDDPDSRFSISAADRFLHHHFVFAADVLDRTVDMSLIPRPVQAAFQAAWSVTVDGRLERSRLPGYSLPLRRGMFSRLFAGSGILLPDHWKIFRSLWDGDLATQDDVLAAVRRLPLL